MLPACLPACLCVRCGACLPAACLGRDMQRHESTLTTWWGLDGKARARTLSNYINTAMQCRQVLHMVSVTVC